jgi:hypothetical protein
MNDNNNFFPLNYFEEWWPYILDFFVSVWETLLEYLDLIEAVFLLASAVFLIAIIIFIKRTKDEFESYKGVRLRDVLILRTGRHSDYFRIWRTIKKDLYSKKEERMKNAVIRARHLLDDLLHEAEYGGSTFGSRLESFVDDINFSERDKLLEAEEVVKNLKKGDLESIDHKKASEIIEVYKKALNDVYPLIKK